MFLSEEYAALVVGWSSIFGLALRYTLFGGVFGVIHIGEDRGSAYEVALSMGTL